ncbi:MAG: PAS domain S-box protein [Deltaproteobacteria bacterium]|nr:PAS domain S-box protein [Deltaproteobacteria bacterium]
MKGFIIPLGFGGISGGILGFFFLKMLNQQKLIKTQNTEIRKTMQRYMELFNLLPNGAELIDEKGIIIECSDNSARMLGYTLDEMIGKPVSSFMCTESSEKFIHNLKFSVTSSRFSEEFTFIRKDGTRVEVLRSGVRISETEKHPAWLCINMDITERKKTQKAKEVMMEQLYHHRRLDALGKLVGGVAHDFNNVLSGISGAASILVLPENNLDGDTLELIKLILQSTKRGSALTSKLLAFSKKETVSFEPTDLKEVLQNSVAILRCTIPKEIKTALILCTEESVISGCASALENAVINLGINAGHAMPEGGTITITTEQISLSMTAVMNSPFSLKAGEYLKITFEDTGSGISPEHIHHIFEPFFTTKPGGEGTGLGLTAVYGIVKDHSGSIEVESETGKGTRFIILFPLLQNTEIETKSIP